MKEKIVTVEQIQELDRIAIEEMGIPSLSLMENAGRAVAKEIIERLKEPAQAKAVVFCGAGNNAGDGFVVARHLIQAGVELVVYVLSKEENLKSDAVTNYHLLKKMECPIEFIERVNENVVEDIQTADVVIDALFGVGLNRDLQDPFYSVVAVINENSKVTVSIDSPSGLDGTTGLRYGICVLATLTVSFSFAKRGFFENDGPSHVGELVVVDIGIPKKLMDQI